MYVLVLKVYRHKRKQNTFSAMSTELGISIFSSNDRKFDNSITHHY